MKTFLILCLAAVLAMPVLFAAEQGKTATPPPAPIPDTRLSLYPGSVFEVPNPAGFVWNPSEPGGNSLLPRPYPTAPPRVPHVIMDFLPITLTENACLDCHALGSDVGAPELPESHRTDLRRAPGKVESAVAGARWMCTSCHVSTSDAKPLRGNSAAP